MINYTIAEFLGIFLVGFPAMLYVVVALFRGVFWIVEIFFVDPTIKNIFHHHFHYKDKRK